jgi:hypothetical protein
MRRRRAHALALLSLAFLLPLAGCLGEEPEPATAGAAPSAPEGPTASANATDTPTRRVGETKEAAATVGPGVGQALLESESEIVLELGGGARDETIVVLELPPSPTGSYRLSVYFGDRDEPIFTVEEWTEATYTAFAYGLAGPYRATVLHNGPHAAFDWTFRVTENRFVPLDG